MSRTADSTVPGLFSDPDAAGIGVDAGFPARALPAGTTTVLLTGAGFATLFLDGMTGGEGGTARFLDGAGFLGAGAETLRGGAPFPDAAAGRTRDGAPEDAAVFLEETFEVFFARVSLAIDIPFPDAEKAVNVYNFNKKGVFFTISTTEIKDYFRGAISKRTASETG